jgi:ATP-binding cassette subfamily B protein
MMLDLPRLHDIVEQHGGSLTLERLPSGAGTSYIVDFPLRAVASQTESAPAGAAARRSNDAEAEAAPALEGARIMLVDDQDDARELLATILSERGAKVQTFARGSDAVRWFEKTAHSDWPDLLICDIGLPDQDGYSVVQRIRALEARERVPLAARMPAIALTGYARPEDRTQALLAGFQMHLGKPVEPRELLASAASLIGSKARERRAQAADRPV